MSEQAELKECPFCCGDKFTSYTQSGDERIGYNITHTITCSTCGCSKSARSKQDKNGWCIEDSLSVKKRAVIAWNSPPKSIDVLKSELECARGDIRTAQGIIGRLQKDADRYRWLRQYGFDIGSFHSAHEYNHQAWFESLNDEQIDACIQEEADQESVK